ncbi:MAG TPA: bifunctional 5,10-methylenetetrahydrofolate dehydrogenase/5,10-methenyltetrahydrofolate cyclohydrolase [Candidatus Saccharimonadia bacterium]|jgi:methylenetetrahydrofolate dehydrogenase (NADP+)/methenyltetrahydrofolate cyclohydrolase|nr:bifunctional 5,10-methylenetetrahydrofolate dehydrogenase/5,10-methenyltetrahydrofolate cyclohydrolase [Candidatus Saccharimonadia bacterium]
MKLLTGRDVADYIKQRHAQTVAGMDRKPKLAIIRSKDNEAGDRYLKMKRQYGEDIGAAVDLYVETSETILDRIATLNDDSSVTGIIIQLPLTDPEITVKATAAVALEKDVDGLAPGSTFEAATPKAVLWLLAAHGVELRGRIVVVGQGKLVGKPLADRLDAQGLDVVRCDINTKDLKAETIQADILFTGTGQEHLIKPDMVKPGAVLVDTGSPRYEFDPALYERDDLTITPNPGGVGPMTVVSLFDNLLIAAQRQ